MWRHVGKNRAGHLERDPPLNATRLHAQTFCPHLHFRSPSLFCTKPRVRHKAGFSVFCLLLTWLQLFMCHTLLFFFFSVYSSHMVLPILKHCGFFFFCCWYFFFFLMAYIPRILVQREMTVKPISKKCECSPSALRKCV